MERDTINELGMETVRDVVFGDRRFRERPHAEMTWRTPGDPEQKDVRILTGYPSVFNQWTTLWETDEYCMREMVEPGFFDGVLEDDFHLNYSHESPSAMCRNKPHMPPEKQDGPGSMELTTDSHGLRVFARVPMNDLDAQRLAPKMDNSVVDQMSFAFSVAEEDCLVYTGEDGRTFYDYTLKRCARMFDITVCPLGAYSQTEAMLRSLASQLSARSQEGCEGVQGRSEEGSEGGSVRSDEGRVNPQVESAARALLRFKPKEAS